MVFIGGWRPRRRRGFGPNVGPGYGPYPGPGYGPGYGPPPGYGGPYRRRGSSCGRDLCLLEGGCCAAEMLGCGPQVTLLVPSLLRRAAHAAASPGPSVATAADAATASATDTDDADRTPQARTLRFLDAAIRIYQTEISPRRPAACRYDPTCSEYARQSLRGHGLRRGSILTIRRLVRCRPGAQGGSDPVPMQGNPLPG